MDAKADIPLVRCAASRHSVSTKKILKHTVFTAMQVLQYQPKKSP